MPAEVSASGRFGSRTFQRNGTTSAKALRPEHVCGEQGTESGWCAWAAVELGVEAQAVSWGRGAVGRSLDFILRTVN